MTQALLPKLTHPSSTHAPCARASAAESAGTGRYSGLLEGGGSLVLFMLLLVVVLVDSVEALGRDINRAAEGKRASDEREVVNSIIILATQ